MFSHNSLRVLTFSFFIILHSDSQKCCNGSQGKRFQKSSFSCDSILLSILFFYFGLKSQNIKQFKTFLSINMNIVEDFHIHNCQECSFHKQFAWWRDDVSSSFQSN